MSDDTIPEVPEASIDVDAPDASQPDGSADGAVGTEAATPATGQARRRRRGSRGGRNRRKKPSGLGANGSSTSPGAAPATDADDEADEAALASEADDEIIVDDDTAAIADRGLTTDDIAEVAREEAGLPPSSPRIGDRRPSPPVRPRVGDTRPAPVAPATGGDESDGGTTTPKKRRRRRGGRGRGRGGSAGATGSTPALDDVVHADLGTDDVVALDLDDDVLERRRGRTRKGRPAGRYLMCVHVLEGGHTHLAVLEGRNLVEHSLATPTGNESIDGNIYLGRVQNVLPGMEAAFIDIGTPKNGVLYRGDVAFDEADVEGGGKPKIERMLKNGQSVLVQVTKNPIAHKGARLTQEVSLAGRFLVMVPGEPETYGISKRLPDDERRRLRRILDLLRPADAGLIVRTAAEGATREELERDVARLRSQWEQISALAAKSKPPRLLYQEPGMVLRLIREEFTKEYRGIVIDDRALYEETRKYVEAIAPELADRVEFYDVEEEGLPIFERFHISEQLLKALDRKVWLPSGGSLVIERTEALTVIDVNTGKNVGRTNLEETVFRNNLEAAEEVARQLRLRDIGGIIVIDFIDMEIRNNREEVMRVFRDALARDKTRTQAFDMSELGLVEMTRKRISEGLVEAFSETCPTCHGRGFLLDESLLGTTG
jgi:ribonuclease E